MAGIDTALGLDAARSALLDTRGASAPGAAAPGDGAFAATVERYAKAARDSAAGNALPGGRVDKTKFTDEEKKLYEACESLETFLVKNMLGGMRKTVMKSGLLDTGFAGEMYEDMLWDEYAKDYTKKAQFGLAELAFLELTHKRGRLP